MAGLKIALEKRASTAQATSFHADRSYGYSWLLEEKNALRAYSIPNNFVAAHMTSAMSILIQAATICIASLIFQSFDAA